MHGARYQGFNARGIGGSAFCVEGETGRVQTPSTPTSCAPHTWGDVCGIFGPAADPPLPLSLPPSGLTLACRARPLDGRQQLPVQRARVIKEQQLKGQLQDGDGFLGLLRGGRGAAQARSLKESSNMGCLVWQGERRRDNSVRPDQNTR